MKITSVEAVPVQIPYRRELHFASGSVSVADSVLVRVHTDEGLTGVAEAPPRPYTYGESPESIAAALHRWFAPALIGMDPFCRELFHARTAWVVGNHTARGALDIALWDIIGQATGQPCHVLLGGFGTSMRVAHMVGFGSPAEMVDDAVEMHERWGITTFKIKVGRDTATDVAACSALRTALGPDVVLYLDANRGWTADQAIRALRAMSDLDLTMVEEPCAVADLLGRKRVVESTHLAVIGDESCTTLAEATRNLLEGLCSGVSIKVARTGFTASQRVLSSCEALGATTLVGNQIDGMVGTLASLAFGAAFQTTATMPGELSNFLGMADDLLAEPLVIMGGSLEAREVAGLGAVLDEDKVRHYRVDT